MAESMVKKKKSWYITKYCLIVLGTLIYAVAFRFILAPNSITAGGLVGISMIINELTGLPIGTVSFVLNVPLFIIAWRHLGLSFMVSSLVGMTLSSVLVDVFTLFPIVLTDDPMLACIVGGVIKGFGLGCIYYVGATAGGMDIATKLLRMKYSFINFGTMKLIMDMVIIFAYACILGKFESSMYAFICMYVVTRVVDLMLYGLDNSCVCHIISRKSRTITDEIISGKLHRGVTILNARGAYSGEHRDLIMCVIKKHQITELRHVVRSIDDKAFVIVSDAKNVFGRGFDSIDEVK